MAGTTTRTLNPLPFDALEPKRFEDLIRQLLYDFRPWRMLEATGRSGSDDGYDARGFEVVSDGQLVEVEEDSQEEAPETTTDRVWLVQCKRERVIGPAKMLQHLAAISESEAQKLYGVIFAAACDFSKATRDAAIGWCRDHGIAEVHLWGKAEVEDQLFQPKNDHLLFAYFGISLQIRKRSTRTSIRATLTMKRKVLRHLGKGWNEHRPIMLRDPEDDRYPYLDEDKPLSAHNWCLLNFLGNHGDHIKVSWRRYPAFLDQDNQHWDVSNNTLENLTDIYENHWINDEKREAMHKINAEVNDFMLANIPEDQRGELIREGYIKYDDIIEIDESGDNFAQCPHVFVSFKDCKPMFTAVSATLIVPAQYDVIDGKGIMVKEPRELYYPPIPDRVEKFPSKFRKEIGIK